jgi:hypothetical protein
MRRKRHKVVPVYMASGYHWCRECGENIRPWGEGYRHHWGPFDSFKGRGS